MSQLNDIAILQPGAHLKARSSSKLQHSRDHCLVVASDMPTFFFFCLKRSIIPALLSSPLERVSAIISKGPICEWL